VTIDHCLLNRMQSAVRCAQVFDAEECPAIERGQKLDAGVDRLEREVPVGVEFADHDCAGAMQVFAQVLKHGARRRHALNLTDGATVKEADGLRCHGESERHCGPGARYAGGRAVAGLAHVDRHPYPKIALPRLENISPR
jgi:hypothetical protein